MTKPDSGAPDPSANQDDAIWLDLVARLEGSSSAHDEALRPGAADAPKPAGADAGMTDRMNSIEPSKIWSASLSRVATW